MFSEWYLVARDSGLKYEEIYKISIWKNDKDSSVCDAGQMAKQPFGAVLWL